MSHWRRALVLACLLLAPCLARADRKEDARAAAERGDHAFRKGAFDEALTEYQASYDKYPKPFLLFRIAECQRSLGKDDDALATYKKYVDKVHKGADLKKAVAQVEALEKKIATRTPDIEPEQPPKPVEQASDIETPVRDREQLEALERERARHAKDHEKDKPIEPRVTTATDPRPAPLPPGWDRALPPTPTPYEEEPRPQVPTYKKWWPWTILGGGVAVGVALTVGLVYGLPKFESELPIGGPGAAALGVRALRVRW